MANLSMEWFTGSTNGPPTTSSPLDWSFTLVSLVAFMTAKELVLDKHPDIAKIYYGAWIFLVLRLHLNVFLNKGLSGFIHLSKRFPTVWINSMLYFPINCALKVFAFMLYELFPNDHAGEMYLIKNGGSDPNLNGGDFTFDRYNAYVMDLNKPLFYRTPKTWLQPTLYPHAVSSGMFCNIYSLGPYTGFGVLNQISGQNHTILRNSIFGTHPSANYYVHVFREDDGNGYIHSVHANAPGVHALYTSAWSFYTNHLVDLFVESEGRVNGAFAGRIEKAKYTKDVWKPHNVTRKTNSLRRDVIGFPPMKYKIGDDKNYGATI